MGMKYLWDTNTAIHYLQNQFPLHSEKFMDSVLQDAQAAISVITEIELLCWKSATEKDITVLKNFIEDSTIFELEQRVKLKTAEIRKAHKIKLPDAIIAATAIVHDLILLTRNISDFKDINGLKLTNPWEK
jgi:predicted nucleic acid-binding protein